VFQYSHFLKGQRGGTLCEGKTVSERGPAKPGGVSFFKRDITAEGRKTLETSHPKVKTADHLLSSQQGRSDGALLLGERSRDR